MAGIDTVEQRADHRYADRRDILTQPGGMFHSDGMMMRQRATETDEALLDRTFDRIVLLKSPLRGRWEEREGEVQAGPGMVGMREVTHDVSLHADLLESLAGSADHTGGETFELRPWSGRL